MAAGTNWRAVVSTKSDFALKHFRTVTYLEDLDILLTGIKKNFFMFFLQKIGFKNRLSPVKPGTMG
jgi:hypothetical protein